MKTVSGRVALWIACFGIVLLASLMPGVSETAFAASSCKPLAAHEPIAKRHGNNSWSDETLRVAKSVDHAVLVPPGWQPVGAEKLEDGCATFPRRQAAVLVNSAEWLVEKAFSDALGIEYRFFILKRADPRQHRVQREMVSATFRDVTTLFPLGLSEDQRYPLDILVTTNIAGDNKTVATRIFPDPGERLITLFYDPKHPRGKDLLIHTTTHLFNKRRPRPETEPVERQLAATEYREYVATWAELAFNHKHKYLLRRIDLLLEQHALVMDDNDATWPKLSALRGLGQTDGPFGVPPFAPKGNKPAREYAHYYLSPLVLLALEGVMATDAPGLSVHGMLRNIHSGSQSGLMAEISNTMPLRYPTVLRWIKGEAHVPEDLVRQGLIRLHSGDNEKPASS